MTRGWILALALVTACSAATEAVAPRESLETNVTAYFPLNEKSRWTYRIRDFTKHLTYRTNVRVFERRHFDFLGREAIPVEERYSSDAGPMFVEEQEPMLYFFDEGFLHRVHLTRKAGKLTPQTGSRDTRHLPERLRDGVTWTSTSTAFEVGEGLGIQVESRHAVSIEGKTVRVPAGTFRNCFRVDTYASHGPDSAPLGDEIVFYYSDWYAPGVGLVRTQQWSDADRTKERTRIELLDFEVAEGDDS